MSLHHFVLPLPTWKLVMLVPPFAVVTREFFAPVSPMLIFSTKEIWKNGNQRKEKT